MPDRQQLTDLQTDVLRLLWEQGELTVAQIWEQLYAERKLAQTTVATIVARLQRRGILSRRSLDRQFVYRALISEADVQHSMVSELTERLFGGDVTALDSVIRARGKRYLMANVPRSALDMVKDVLPGLNGPTVIDILNGGAFVAVHAVVPADAVYRTIGSLKSLGSEGILVTRIERLMP